MCLENRSIGKGLQKFLVKRLDNFCHVIANFEHFFWKHLRSNALQPASQQYLSILLSIGVGLYREMKLPKLLMSFALLVYQQDQWPLVMCVHNTLICERERQKGLLEYIYMCNLNSMFAELCHLLCACVNYLEMRV